jgi:hypothetical protein
VEDRVADAAGRLPLIEQALGREVGDGRIMMVEARDQDAPGFRAGGLGQGLVPAVEGVVADLAPVDRDQDDRRPAAHYPRKTLDWAGSSIQLTIP